jgi:hypothetical protein
LADGLLFRIAERSVGPQTATDHIMEEERGFTHHRPGLCGHRNFNEKTCSIFTAHDSRAGFKTREEYRFGRLPAFVPSILKSPGGRPAVRAARN